MASNRSGGMVSSPRTPTSVQGRYYAAGGRSALGQAGPGGRGRAATYVQPRRGRAG